MQAPKSQTAAELSPDELRAALESSAAPLVVVDGDFRLCFLNAAARTLLDADVGDSLDACAHPSDIAALRALDGQTGNGRPAMVRMRDTAGVWSAALRVRPLGMRRLMLLQRDDSDGAARRSFDGLTGLPNREALMARLERSLTRALRFNEYTFAVLLVDLDRFSLVNTTLGSTGGDYVLKVTAKRISECIRPGDMVARVGPDQFAVIADHMRGDTGAIDVSRVAERIQAQALGEANTEMDKRLLDATRVAERIQDSALAPPITLDSREVFPTASIGITVMGSAYENAEQMFRDADAALHRAKAAGGARYQLFDAQMHALASERLALETDLRRALDRGQFRLLYQPIVDLASLEISGFECLLRWEHAERGLLLPGHFIRVAEDTGLLPRINMWVLQAACRNAQDWRSKHPRAAEVSVAVNFSSASFESGDFVKSVADALDATGSGGNLLKLELTESAMVQHLATTTSTLEQLQQLGVDVHLDDFGTGYSSLSYVHKLPVAAIKIDQSFVKRIAHDANASQMVRTIVELGHGLQRHLIAEGIETKAQLKAIRELGCEFGQGYFFSPAVDADAAEALLAAPPPWLAKI